MEQTRVTLRCNRRRAPLNAVIGIVIGAMAVLSAATAFSAQTTLAWNAPTTYTDGSPLTSVGGYKLHYGTASGSYSQTVDVGNQTSYTLSNLSDGTTYYFAVTAYDSTGSESAPSNEVSKTFAAVPVTYNVTATTSIGGTITSSTGNPSSQAGNGASVISSFTVNSGSNMTLTITPAANFRTTDVKVDGVSVGAVGSYTFGNITANHTIAATFTSASTLKGDVNGDGVINMSDAILLLQAVQNKVTLTPDQKARGDVYPLDASGHPAGDGKITMDDVLLLTKRVVGLISW